MTHLGSLNLTVKNCKRPLSGRSHSHAQAMSATAKVHSLDGSDFTTALGVTFGRFGGLTTGAARMATHQKTTHATIAGLSSCCTPLQTPAKRFRTSDNWGIPYEADKKWPFWHSPLSIFMKLYGLTLPWVKRNVIIFCRRAAFRFRDIRHQTLVLREHTTILKAS